MRGRPDPTDDRGLLAGGGDAGAPMRATVAKGFLDPGMEMITKPFAVEALAAKIRGMIRGA